MQLGDTIKYAYSEFDGFGVVIGEITEIHEDHVIMTGKDGIHYWFDNCNIGNMDDDHMDVQVIPKDYVDTLSKRLESLNDKLERKELSPEEERKCKKEILGLESEAKYFKNYLISQNKYRTLGVAPYLNTRYEGSRKSR